MAVLAGGAVRRPSRFRYWRQWLTAYLFIAPWLFFVLVFMAGAIVLALYFSFTDYDLLSDPVFVGLKNYEKAFQDQSFLHAIRNVATYTAVVVPSQTFIGLVMAAILDRKIPFRRFFRIAWHLPCVPSSVVTTPIFMWLFLPDGFIKPALNFVGIAVRLHWLGDHCPAPPRVHLRNRCATPVPLEL